MMLHDPTQRVEHWNVQGPTEYKNRSKSPLAEVFSG